ncbi:hypothetical protein VIBNISOn1_1470007 [Vibrio nigripulchritudo SOn1]|uniref:Uncharacterized protein n=1 Tax=Vibrio nigripulchritudo SOn1 TaxID=1238450 RepID=A0AAV2VLM6_9VIBR|nr:hypothetical protein VIBNISOn1_1470007 [Vibrio nigripulchritudo SOn1]
MGIAGALNLLIHINSLFVNDYFCVIKKRLMHIASTFSV